jgi:hypothetical protein
MKKSHFLEFFVLLSLEQDNRKAFDDILTTTKTLKCYCAFRVTTSSPHAGAKTFSRLRHANLEIL